MRALAFDMTNNVRMRARLSARVMPFPSVAASRRLQAEDVSLRDKAEKSDSLCVGGRAGGDSRVLAYWAKLPDRTWV
jgi:hypothetical protein